MRLSLFQRRARQLQSILFSRIGCRHQRPAVNYLAQAYRRNFASMAEVRTHVRFEDQPPQESWSVNEISCGFIVYRDFELLRPQPTSSKLQSAVGPTKIALPSMEVLVMHHRNRLDFPKGHLEPQDASELDGAFRELEEESGLGRHQIVVDPTFLYEHIYYPKLQRLNGRRSRKTLKLFLGQFVGDREVEIAVTEHQAASWEKVEPGKHIHPHLDRAVQAALKHISESYAQAE